VTKNRDRLLFWREGHPAASKGFAFASLLTQASIASRCQFRSRAKSDVWWLVNGDWWMAKIGVTGLGFGVWSLARAEERRDFGFLTSNLIPHTSVPPQVHISYLSLSSLLFTPSS